jgi:FkbM family methyltransferase
MSVASEPRTPRPVVLTRFYRSMMRITKRRGMRTLSRWNARLYPHGQYVPLAAGCDMFMPPDPHFFGYLVGHEPHIARLIEETVEEGDVCVDVGANIGYFSLMMAARCGASGRVFAYEPEPANFRVLSKNVGLALDRGLRITATEAAVSEHGGGVSLVRGEESTLHQVRELDGSESAGEVLRSVNLGEDLAVKGVTEPIKLVKIDVEGHEVAVLRGCAGLLRSGAVRMVVIEVTAGEQARAIDALLGVLGAPPAECWLEGAWRPLPVSEIPHRTDVLLHFGSGSGSGP